MAPREVSFHSRGLSDAYARPTDFALWVVEASSRDVGVPGEVSDAFLAPEGGSTGTQPPIDTAVAEGVHVFASASVDDDGGTIASWRR